MNLFVIDETGTVKVNSPWIKLIPEFAAIFMHTVKSSKFNIPYDRNVQARKMLAYIYFMQDFSSPIYTWEDDKRKEESLKYTDLKEEDVDKDIMVAAMEKYQELQYEMCRPLKTYKAALKGLDGLDRHLNGMDFTKLDKQGKMLYTPNQFLQTVSLINKSYEELAKIKKQIEETLAQTSGIRGSATMGDREMNFTSAIARDSAPIEEGSDEDTGGRDWKELDGILGAQ